MVYVTGDTHTPVDIHKLSTTMFPEQKTMTKDDYVIVCGDFGAVWDGSNTDRYWQKWYKDKNFTTLFVDGNHENFHLLQQFPEREFCGGKVHEIAPSVFHLKRGEIFHIDGKSFFCLGGASSHDKQFRVENVSWWREELPSKQELEHAYQTLEGAGWRVDYIITHCAPKKVQAQIAEWYENDSATSFLQIVEENCEFKHWFFGHYHRDLDLDPKHTCLYQRIIPIK